MRSSIGLLFGFIDYLFIPHILHPVVYKSPQRTHN